MGKLMVSLAAVSTVTTACAGFQTESASPSTAGQQGTPAPAEAQVIQVRATDYAFEGVPETIQAGEVTFVLTNDGDVPHELSIGTIPRNMTMEEVARKAAGGDAGGRRLGLVPAVEPGASGEVTLQLGPGRHGYACFVGEGTGDEPHVLHGMGGEFTVVDD